MTVYITYGKSIRAGLLTRILRKKKHLRRYVLSLLSFPMTDFRQKDKTSMHTATGIVTDSHRVPFSPPKPVRGTLQPWRHSV